MRMQEAVSVYEAKIRKTEEERVKATKQTKEYRELEKLKDKLETELDDVRRKLDKTLNELSWTEMGLMKERFRLECDVAMQKPAAERHASILAVLKKHGVMD